jgi:uncharacterized protein
MSTNQSVNAVDSANSKISVALMIQHRVRPDALDRYEQWLKVVSAEAAEYPGHQGLHVIRPSIGGNEYTMIVRFATMADTERSTSSVDRQRLIDQIADVFERGDRFHFHPGIEFWFAPQTPSQKRRGAGNSG